MTLTLEQWHEILNVVRSNSNSNGNDILEQIKAELKKQDKGTFQTWEQRGFDVNHLFNIQRNQMNRELTLLHIAAFNGRLDIIRYFVDEKKVDINKADNDGNTALHFAAFNGHLGIVKYLVDEKKVDVNKADNDGYTALRLAAFNGHLDIVKYLVDEKKVDINKADNDGATALDKAAFNGHLDTVKYLVDEKKVDINKADNDGEIALHKAAFNGHLDTVKYLVDEKKADVNKANNRGNTALHKAAFNGHLGIVKYLVDEKKVDINKADNDGEIALHFAAKSDKMTVVKFLLNKGADSSLKDQDGKTPRDLADSENMKQLIKEAENKQAIPKKNVSSISNVQPNNPHSTKGNKLPIITACTGLLLGLGIAYLAGAATLTPVGAVVAVFVAAAAVGALVGYGVGKVSQKLFVESIKEHPELNKLNV